MKVELADRKTIEGVYNLGELLTHGGGNREAHHNCLVVAMPPWEMNRIIHVLLG
jgi:hypothetical protein